MRYDFSPLSRSTVGFDRLFDLIGNLDQERAPSYPPRTAFQLRLPVFARMTSISRPVRTS